MRRILQGALPRSCLMCLCLHVANLARRTSLLLRISLSFQSTGCLEYQKTVHVSLRGNDTKRCGSIKKPCRTIVKAVTLVSRGGMVILNGSGTAKQPYDCEQLTTQAQQPGIQVTRNITITSLLSTEAHVTCPKGFLFYRSDKVLRISLSGISFFKTTLKFKDCNYVEIINCTLRERHGEKTEWESAVVIRVRKNMNVNVTIRNSVFLNNSLCVRIHFDQLYPKTDILLSLNVAKTRFQENGFHTKSLERGAIVFSATQTRIFSRTIYLQITMNEVYCISGGGHFLDVELPTAVSKETYCNIYLERNSFMNSRSLYYSRVRRANVSFFKLQCANNSEVRCITVQSFTNANRTIDIRVHGSRFFDNRTNRTKLVPTLRVTGTTTQSGTIEIFNTSFDRSYKAAVSITSNIILRMKGVTVTSSMYGVIIEAYDKLNMNDSNFYSVASIDNCTFRDNLMDLYGLLNNSVLVQIRVTNTIFDGKAVQEKYAKTTTYGVRMNIPPLDKQFLSEANILIENATFRGRPTNAFVFVAKGNKTLIIRSCKFQDSFSLERNVWRVRKYANLPGYMTAQGVFLLLFDSDELVEKGCVKGRGGQNTHPKWNYTSRVLFEDTLFQDNFGFETGAIKIINGYVTFRRCNFTNNFALSDTGHLYVGYGSGKVEFKDCTFKRTERQGIFKGTAFTVGRFLHSESGGPIMIKNTTFETKFGERLVPQSILRIFSGGYFDMDLNSTIQCRTGSSLQFENFSHFHYEGGQDNTFCRINVTTERFTCTMCPPKMYSLQSGFSKGLFIRKGFRCLECPFGAHCNGSNNIVAKRNFWGYKVTNSSNSSSVVFIPCPEKYCRKPERHSLHQEGFNSCNGNRQGVLCGRCSPGFTETLFSAECRKSEECRWNYQLWIFMVLYTIALTFYLLKKPPLVHFLKNQILWFGRIRQQTVRGRTAVLENKEGENGYLKITFYFYQAFDLLSTTNVRKMMAKVPYISTMVAAFNFQVQVVHERIGCPFAGLTAVTKEIFLSGLVLAAIGHVFLIYCLHWLINLTLKKRKPLLVHYVAVAMEIVLLGYERLAETSLKLMHCVPIGSKMHLYYDGNVVCWQWWQHALLAFNVIFIVPFVGVLYLGSGKLYYKTISWKEFIGACVAPLPFLIFWLVKRCCWQTRALQPSNARQKGKPVSHNRYTRLSSLIDDENTSHDSEECTKEISNILLGPFRPPNAHDQGTLYWESVLIGRRLVLLIFRAFIPNSMVCFLCMSVACVLMAVHHLIKKPFRDRTADRMETFSLVTLSCIAIINVITATLASSAVQPEGANKRIVVVLRWIQVAFLGFPFAVFALLILFALLSQLVRFVILLKRKLCRAAKPNI